MHYSHTTAGVICFSRFASLFFSLARSLALSQVAQLPHALFARSAYVYIHILSLLRAKELSHHKKRKMLWIVGCLLGVHTERCALCSCCCLASNRFVLILTCSLFVSLGAHLVSESQICSIISQPRWTNIKNVALACLSLSLVRLAGSLRYDTRDAARANTNNLMRVCMCIVCYT